VGFTHSSSCLDPATVIAKLDKLFSLFDEIAHRHGIEKLKTMGDGYMCAAGLLPGSDPNPANACSAALEMLRAVYEERKTDGQAWSIRIGINTGTVIAGIIGKSKFSFDVWGDNVNMASRMESNGIVDGINVSASTYAMVADHFDFRPRGLVEIKGGDRVEMYHLLGEKDISKSG
jgi:class 3 adenylate cyclase